MQMTSNWAYDKSFDLKLLNICNIYLDFEIFLIILPILPTINNFHHRKITFEWKEPTSDRNEGASEHVGYWEIFPYGYIYPLSSDPET